MRFTLLLAGVLLGAAAHAQVDGGAPASLPERVFVPSATRGVTVKYFAAVEDGHLWMKKNPDWAGVPDGGSQSVYRLDEHVTGAWQPFFGTGLPVVEGVPTRITEISIDDERLVARAESGDLIRFEDGVWNRPWGLPLPMPGFLKPLQLPADTTRWTLSMRLGQVQYYEDHHGNQFNYGAAGCTTVFALRGDGARIAMGDPWFPPDFAREMCGPRRGTFKAVGLAASASTSMVIDAAGTVFTRFFDYDANGGTPFFRFRYAPFERQPLPGSDPASENQIRGLPERPWVQEPRIPAVGLTRLTKNLAVLQNGVGNDARELRVQALGPDGRAGYFTKALTEKAWRFVPTGESLAEADFIANDSAKTESAPSRDRRYSGAMTARGKRLPQVAYVTIPDFNFHCGPSRLTFVLQGGQSVSMTLHLVDSWSLFESEDPEDTPNAVKMLKATVELDEEARTSQDVSVREFLDVYFPGAHLSPFAFELIANQHELRLFTVTYPAPLGRKDFELKLTVPGVRDLRLFPYQQRYRELLASGSACVPHATFQRLLAERAALDEKAAFIQGLVTGIPMGTVTADILSVITTTRWTLGAPTLMGFNEHHPALTAGMQRATELFRQRSADDYAAVRAMLQARLCKDDGPASAPKDELVPAPDASGTRRGAGGPPGGNGMGGQGGPGGQGGMMR